MPEAEKESRLRHDSAAYLARRQGLEQAMEVARWYEEGACSSDCNLLVLAIEALIDGTFEDARKAMGGHK